MNTPQQYKRKSCSLTIVSPVRNEVDAIGVFVDRVTALRWPLEVSWRILFVEDSSTDGTKAKLAELSASDSRIGYIEISNPYGQAAAVMTGVANSRTDAIVMLDVDGSHPIDKIPEMVGLYSAGNPIVQCRRNIMTGRLKYRQIGYHLFHNMMRLIGGTDLRKQDIYYRLVDSDVAGWMTRYPPLWRYLRFDLSRGGCTAPVFLDVNSAERELGASKYNLPRLIRTAFTGLICTMSFLRVSCFLALSALLSYWLYSSQHFVLAGVPFGAMAIIAGFKLYFRYANPRARLKTIKAVNIEPSPETGR